MSMSVCKRRIKNIIGRVPEMISQSEHSDELDMIIAELDEQFSKYASLLSEKHIDFQDEEGHTEFDRIEASYSDAKLKLKRQSASLRQNAKESSACSDDKMIELLNQQQNILDIMSRQSASASTTRPVDRNEQPMRLPKITIPKFSGDYRQWLTFRDLFETSVIANNSLSDIQKFSYLKSLLSGQAASLITSMPLEGERFSTAWDLVRNRYEKPYLLIQSTISNIVRLQVSPEPQQLRQVLNFLIESWETLKSQGDYARSPDPWAISLFLERVDIESRKSWAEYSSQNDAPSVKEFLDFMEQRCAAEEIFNSGSKNKTKISHSKNPSVRVNFNKVTQCMYCHQNHSIYKCTTFKSLSIKDRENFIIREARCVNCFSRTHNVSDCRSSFTCSTCKGKHNSLLHESKTLGDGSKKNESHSSDTIRVLSSVQHCSSFLLPTVILRARNVFGQFVELRALLDSGAQASLISESFFNKLGIKRDYSRLPITSLTSTGPIFSKGKVTLKLFSRLDDYSFDITAHILQKVMSDLPNEDINLKSSSDLRKPKLQVCSSAGTATGCCSEAVERQFFHYGKNSFTKKLREAISKLSSILRSRYKKFNEYFQEMLNKSQSDFNEMFTQTYGILYVQNSNVFTNFFQQLQNYYINGDMDMTVVLDNFFVTLYKRMFEVINSQYKFDKKYLSCATDQMQELKPFGDIPNRLSIQLKRSFIATRSFSQALDVGATIAKNMLKINLTEECLKSLLNMQFCSACSATIEIHACSNYCINVMKGCLAHFTELESDWNAYVDAIDKITDRLLGSYNIKIVVEPIDIKISDAIMMFQENGQIISQKVFNTCGQPVHNRKSRSTMVQRGRGGGGGGRNRISKRQNSHHEKRNSKRRRKSKNSNQLPLLRHHEPQTGQNFEKIVKEIKIKIKEAKYFWSHLPYLFCNDKNLAEGPSRNIHCWNGTVVDRYLPSIVRDGFVNQKDNPSVIVDVNKRSKVLFEQMLLLKSISKKLQNAHQGVDVNWTENENIADEIAGSGFVWTDDSIDNDPKQIEEKWKLIENPVSPFETTPSINNRPFTRPATATIIITTTKPIPDTNRSNSIDFSISASTTTIMSKTTTTTTTPFSTNDIFDGDTSNEIDTGSFAFPITPHHPFTLLVINLIVILYTCFV